MINKKYFYLALFIMAAFIFFAAQVILSQLFNFQPVQKDYKGKTFNTTIEVPNAKYASCFIVTSLRHGYVLAPVTITGPLNEFIFSVSCKDLFGNSYSASASGGGYSNSGSPNATKMVMPLNSYDDNAEVYEGPPSIGIGFSVPKQ